MNRTAVYTGSFDPPTLGHLDVIRRSATLFDRLIVAIGEARGKMTLFTTEERLRLIRECCADFKNVEAQSFSGLAVTYASSIKAVALVRGVRTAADYTYEMTMAHMNRALCPGLETLLIPTSPEFSHISSSLAKEIAMYKGDVGLLVPMPVAVAFNGKSDLLNS